MRIRTWRAARHRRRYRRGIRRRFLRRTGLLRGRMVIPIRNVRGRIVAYAGRALDGALPKYKLPAGFRKAWELFNVPRAVATGSRTVILVEGYFDCMRVHQAGFPLGGGSDGDRLYRKRSRLPCCVTLTGCSSCSMEIQWAVWPAKRLRPACPGATR